jgi:hypothetical protein
MELLIAFLIAFGVVSSKDNLTESQAKDLLTKSKLEKEYIIFGQETDDF